MILFIRMQTAQNTDSVHGSVEDIAKQKKYNIVTVFAYVFQLFVYFGFLIPCPVLSGDLDDKKTTYKGKKKNVPCNVFFETKQ